MAELTVVNLHEIDDVVAKRYRIYALLGRGGTGSTYQAEDLRTRRWVALKVMSLKQLGNWDLLTRFEREAEALGKIDHPGVPDYIEHFQVETADDCRFYLVQEFAAGKSLDRWVADGWRATEAEVKRIGAEVLNTLAYLHELDPPMIHRDIKPQNIIRQPNGRIYLVDFGAVQSVCRDALQQRGTFVGTMGYMPPEQLRGKAVFASDLYGLGATLVFLLTHRNPDELPMERMRIAFRGRVKLSEGFASWLEKMLEPMVKNRWGIAAISLQALETCSLRSNISIKTQTQESDSLELKNRRICVEIRNKSLRVFIQPSGQSRKFKQYGIAILIGLLLSWCVPALFPLLFTNFSIGLVIYYLILLSTETRRFRNFGYNWLLISPNSYAVAMKYSNRISAYKRNQNSCIMRAEVKSLEIEMQEEKKHLYLVDSSGHLVWFAGELGSEEVAWLAQKINGFLEKQHIDYSSIDPSAKMSLKAKQ